MVNGSKDDTEDGTGTDGTDEDGGPNLKIWTGAAVALGTGLTLCLGSTAELTF